VFMCVCVMEEVWFGAHNRSLLGGRANRVRLHLHVHVATY
jgi:hypothetical protein